MPASAGAAVLNRAANRSTPRQARSRNRQTALLDEAELVIADVGLDGLSMREVARRANVPIASVYHYFPSAPAVVRAIALRQLALCSAFVTDRLNRRPAPEQGPAALAQFATAIIAELVEFLGDMPAAAAVWAAMRSNPELRLVDRADTIQMARSLAPIIAPICAGGTDDAESLAIVILEMAAINIVFALESDDARRAIHIRALQTFLSAAILGLAGSPDQDGALP